MSSVPAESTQTFPNWHEGVAHLLKVDPVLAAIIDRYPDGMLVPKGDLFQTLIRSIVGQQISVKAAQTVWDRFVAVCGEVTPGAIQACTEDALRGAGLSRMKASYIQGIAANPDPLNLSELMLCSDDDVLKRLTAYRGVGEWTAQMCMMFSLCRPDILSLKDIGLRRGVEKHYNAGVRMTDSEIRAVAAPWAPWRSIATWYLWRSLDPIPVEY